MLSAVAFILSSAIVQSKELRWASDGDLTSMDPHSRAETFQFGLLNNVYESLIQRNRALEFEPALALSWSNPEPTVWRFVLRQGVRFHDGSAFTAEDVVFSFVRALGPTSDMKARVAAIKEVKRIDDYTVDFITRYPDPILPNEIQDIFIMPKAWSEAKGAAQSYDFRKQEDNYAHVHANGTGPFKLAQREQGIRTVLEVNPGWWGKPEHNLTKIEFRVIGADATRIAAFLSGEVDFVYSVPPQDIQRLARTAGVKMMEGPEARVIYLALNTALPELPGSDVKGKNPLADLKVRQAFMQAIDVNTIAAKVMRGAAAPTNLIVSPQVEGYDKSLDIRPAYNVDAAKKLLAEAGYPSGFSMGMDCPNDRYVNDEAICTAIVGMLARAGVKISLNAQSKTRFFPLLEKRESAFHLLGYSPGTYDSHVVLLRLLATPSAEKRSGQTNYGGYSNPTLDALTDKIATETDQPKRRAMIAEALRIVRDDIAVIPLHNQALAWALRSNIDMVQPADNRLPFRYARVN